MDKPISVTPELFFNTMCTYAKIMHIGLTNIDASLLKDLCVTVCKGEKWKASYFTFEFDELVEFFKSKGITIKNYKNGK